MTYNMLKKNSGDCYHLLNACYVAVPCLCPLMWFLLQGLWALRQGRSVWAGWGEHHNHMKCWWYLPDRTWGFRVVRTGVEGDCKMSPNFTPLYIQTLCNVTCSPSHQEVDSYFLHREYRLALWLALANIKWQCDSVPDPRHLCISSLSPCLISRALLDTCLLLREQAWAAPWITRHHVGYSRISQA